LQATQEEQIRAALNAHWHELAADDANAEHNIYDDDAICDYPQSGERIGSDGYLPGNPTYGS
jgi:ketosteroid isomerase-like protein